MAVVLLARCLGSGTVARADAAGRWGAWMRRPRLVDDSDDIFRFETMTKELGSFGDRGDYAGFVLHADGGLLAAHCASSNPSHCQDASLISELLSVVVSHTSSSQGQHDTT